MTSQTTRTFTIGELAAAAGVTEDAMLRRVADVIAKLPWHRRMAFHYKANRQLGIGRIKALWLTTR